MIANENRYGLRHPHASATSKITPFLTMSINLVQLELTNDISSNRSRPIIPAGILPKLSILKLSKGSIEAEGAWLPYSLLTSITNLPALKHLQFDGIRLLRNTWYDMPPLETRPADGDPWISNLIILCWQMSLQTDLESCTGLSTIRDSKDDASVHVHRMGGATPGKAVLCHKISQAVCHKRKWPALVEDMQQSGSENLSSNRIVRYRAFLEANWSTTTDEFEHMEGDPFEEPRISVPMCGFIRMSTKQAASASHEYHRALRQIR